MPINLDLLDLIGKRLETKKESLGVFYRPLVHLVGASEFLVLFSLLLAVPFTMFDELSSVVFTQIALVVVYSVIIGWAERGAVEGFVFGMLMLVVFSAAPAVIGGEPYFSLLTTSAASDAPVELPAKAFYMYALKRGIANTAWAAPILLVFLPGYPRWKKNPQDRDPLVPCLWLGLALHTVAVVFLLWQDAVFQRFFASTEGAVVAARESVHQYQWGYLVFSLLYMLLGFVALLGVRLSRGQDWRVVAAVTS